MKDKITAELHEVAVELRKANFTLERIASMLGLHHSVVARDLAGQRKTPYRPSPETAIPILESALAKLRAKSAA